MRDYPATLVPVNHVEPVPRRLRGTLGDRVVFDTTRALYVWEISNYPAYYIPEADIAPGALVDEDHPQHTRRGLSRVHGLRVGDVVRPSAARLYVESDLDGVVGRVRFDWDALDGWYEEDERVFVHPRSPYVRVDCLRSNRSIRVELDGVVLAQATSSIMLFETGLPTRYYLDRTSIRFEHLSATGTVTQCPYKGTTSGYWSAHVGGLSYPDLAWTYDFPARGVLPIAGLVAFYNERVDIVLDGELLERPDTRFRERGSPSDQGSA